MARRVPERRLSIRAISTALRLDDLVANRTMSRDIAETLRGIARERRSFIVLAVPRLAGRAPCCSDSRERPAFHADRDARGGCLDIDGSIKKSAGATWSSRRSRRARRCPATSGARTFAGSSVAKGRVARRDPARRRPDDAFAQICQGCGVPDADASKVNSSFTCVRSADGRNRHAASSSRSTRFDAVKGGKPTTKLLHGWDEQHDRFI